jgi:hypothetical protein
VFAFTDGSSIAAHDDRSDCGRHPETPPKLLACEISKLLSGSPIANQVFQFRLSLVKGYWPAGVFGDRFPASLQGLKLPPLVTLCGKNHNR